MEEKIKAVIVDDEPKLAEVLRIKIEKFTPIVDIVGTAENVNDAYALIKALNPALVFLDISMPGQSGFGLIDRFNQVDFQVIFVTGFSEFALDAIKVSAVDYLLKPVKTEDLIAAVDKAKNRINDVHFEKKYNLLKHNVRHVGNQDSKIVIPGNDQYEFVFVKNIIRCEGFQKYTYIYLSDGRKILSSYNIGTYRDLLRNYSFFSTHKSHLINIRSIRSYLREGTVVMIGGDTVPVSRRRKEAFVKEVMS